MLQQHHDLRCEGHSLSCCALNLFTPVMVATASTSMLGVHRPFLLANAWRRKHHYLLHYRDGSRHCWLESTVLFRSTVLWWCGVTSRETKVPVQHRDTRTAGRLACHARAFL